jgi:hypothetical protein
LTNGQTDDVYEVYESYEEPGGLESAEEFATEEEFPIKFLKDPRPAGAYRAGLWLQTTSSVLEEIAKKE